MAFFEITGLGTVVVSSGEQEPLGNLLLVRSFDQTLRTVAKPRKRVWNMTTTEMTLAEYNAFIAAVQDGITVTCTGDFLESGSLTAKIEIVGKAYITSDNLRRVQQFRVHEV